MGIAKKLEISKKLLFAFLVVFPLGQIARVEIIIGYFRVPILAVDFLSILFLFILLSGGFLRPKIWYYLICFVLTCLFTWIWSIGFFNTPEALFGGLYIIRLSSYFAFFVVLFNLTKNEKVLGETLYASLILIAFFVGLLGWIQYFFYPDLRGLLEWNWDEHLYRLTSTFLDPGFTSILLVFGFLATLAKFKIAKQKVYLAICVFLFTTVLFTYSRAGYIALFVGTWILFPRNFFKVAIFGLVLFMLVLMLPRPDGEGVKLERTASIAARVLNYKQTLNIIESSPLVGVGYNNICLAKKYFLGITDSNSHSCSGSDNSFLLVFATTGILGMFSFILLIKKMIDSTSGNYKNVFLASSGALFVHSAFTNSIFYPWILGWMFCLLALSTRE